MKSYMQQYSQLTDLFPSTSPCRPSRIGRHRVVTTAVRKKPGRVTGKQAGSTYYQNYLRNRQAKGGEFLGPPVALTTEQQQQQQQQQQQALAERYQAPQQQLVQQHRTAQQLLSQQQSEVVHEAGVPPQGTSTATVTPDHTLHDQQQQLPPDQEHQPQLLQPQAAVQPAASPPHQSSHEANPRLHPAQLQQLLQDCLAAAAPQPAAAAAAQYTTAHPAAPLGHQQQEQQQQAPPLSPVEQQRRRTKQQQPRDLPDYVRPELAGSVLSLVGRKRGLTVQPPVITTGQPLVVLPPLPDPSANPHHAPSIARTHASAPDPQAAAAAWHHSSSSSSRASDSSSGGGSSSSSRHTSDISSSGTSSSSSSSSQEPQPRRRLLHVFWDMSSLHPGGHDPRVVVAQLRRVLSVYGDVAGIYAYGIQKLFNWVPEAFMLQYRPERLPGRQRSQQLLQPPDINIQAQQQEVALLLQQAAEAGVALEEQLGPLRCRVCGKLRDNYRQLHAHMVQRHKQPAPPLDKLLPEGALAAMVAAAIAAATTTSSSSRGPSQVARGAAARAQGFTWRVADPWAMRNSSSRSLGRVTRYFNSRNEQFLPPEGHQMSLKYVLVREGVEVRTVQRQARAVSAAVSDALHALLHEQLLARSAEEVQRVQDVLVVVSDKVTHAAVLRDARRAGVPSVAVCGKLKRYQGADVTLRWQWVVAGQYGGPQVHGEGD